MGYKNGGLYAVLFLSCKNKNVINNEGEGCHILPNINKCSFSNEYKIIYEVSSK